MMSQPQQKPEESTDGRRHQMVLRAGSGLTSVTSKNQKMEAEETNPKSETQDTEAQAGAVGGVQEAEETTVEKMPRQQPSRPASQVSRSSARRPMSQVSCSSVSSRASVEAQLAAKLKNLRVKQMERKMEIERQEEQKRRKRQNELKRKEDELKHKEDEMKCEETESKRQRELQALKDEAEEAELEARLRIIMEDNLNADRKNDFLDENIGETENDRSFQPKQEVKTPPCSSLPQPRQEPVSQPSPQRNSVTWIDELPGTAAPAARLQTGSPPQSRHASAFLKSIPRLTLPVYSGDPLEWPRWVGLFRALIHEQPSLSDSERMAHLQASVTGTAQQAIAGMLFDGNLYRKALKTLQNRFGQSGDIIRAHLGGIFSAEPPLEDDAASLESFQATVHCAVTIMQSQGYDADLSSTENLRRAVAKLPPYHRRLWAEFTRKLHPEEPSLLDLDTWLQEQVKVAVLCAGISAPGPKETGDRSREPVRRSSHATGVSPLPVPEKVACLKCGGDHALSRCDKFKALKIEERMEFVYNKGLCLSCLTRGHMILSCPCIRTCGQDGCRRRHNRLLHGGVIRKREQLAAVHPTAAAAADAAADHKNVTGTDWNKSGRRRSAADARESRRRGTDTRGHASACPGQKTGAILQVVPVTVYGQNGNQQTYALLDSGSETSFCTEALLNKLEATGQQTKLRLRTVDGDSEEKLSTRGQLQISATGPSAADHRRRIMVPEAWSVATLKVSRPPVSQEQLDSWTHLRGLEIPNCSDMTVELLLGANVTEAVIQHEVRVGQPGQPIAVRTAFGWAMTGLVSEAPKASRQVMFVKKGQHVSGGGRKDRKDSEDSEKDNQQNEAQSVPDNPVVSDLDADDLRLRPGIHKPGSQNRDQHMPDSCVHHRELALGHSQVFIRDKLQENDKNSDASNGHSPNCKTTTDSRRNHSGKWTGERREDQN